MNQNAVIAVVVVGFIAYVLGVFSFNNVRVTADDIAKAQTLCADGHLGLAWVDTIEAGCRDGQIVEHRGAQL